MFKLFKKNAVKKTSKTILLSDIKKLIGMLVDNDIVSDEEAVSGTYVEYSCKVLENGNCCHIHIKNLRPDSKNARWRYIGIKNDLESLSVAGDWVSNRKVLFAGDKDNHELLEPMRDIRRGFIDTGVLQRRKWVATENRQLKLYEEK